MGRFERSVSLFKSSWAVVRSDRELLLLPVVSTVVSILVAATFAVPGWLSLKETAQVGLDGSQSTGYEASPLTFVMRRSSTSSARSS